MLAWAWLAITIVLGIDPAIAQQWPSRIVRIIVPGAPGDGPDSAARVLAPHLEREFGHPFIVDNMPGAGGVLGSQAAARSAPDGYTLIIGNAGSHGINAAIYASPKYDPIEDFVPISMIYSAPNIFVASKSLALKSLNDLIALAKTRNGKFSYASGGIGSSAHLNAEYLKYLAGFSATHVPYRGASLGLNDLIAGHVDFMAGNLPPAMELITSGKIDALAVTSAARSKLLAQVPTVAESGFPGYETTAWFGLLAPKDTSRAIVEKLHAAVVGACQSPAMTDRLVGLGGDVVCNRPEAFAARIKADVERWKKVVAEAKIQIN
jgi:tripartite-type tricarboxylate transporter receptor subunit TctC